MLIRDGEWFLLLLYAHRHRSVLGAAGHIILTPANQLIVMGLKIWSLSNPGFKPGTFRSMTLATALMTHKACIYTKSNAHNKAVGKLAL
jgi:hypothetical protein